MGHHGNHGIWGGTKMLVLTRNDGETLILRKTGAGNRVEEIKIVVRLDGQQVKLAIDAPRGIKIVRKELSPVETAEIHSLS